MEGWIPVKISSAVALALLVLGNVGRVDAGDTSRLSVDTLGGDGNAASSAVAVSADGRYVVFQSSATDLVAPATNGFSQIFRRDRQTGTTILVSVGGAGQGNAGSREPAISADGNRVAFTSDAGNLIGAADTNGTSDVYLRDITAGTTTRVSVATGGGEAHGNSFDPAVSADGQVVSFTSDAADLIGTDGNLHDDIFVRDLLASTTERVSVSSAGTEGNSDSFQSAISDDGNLVAFASDSDNFVTPEENGWIDVFVRDRQAGTTVRITLNRDDLENDGPSFAPAISGDGRYVAFQSFATDLVPGDKNGVGDIFVRDLQAQTTERVSVDSTGVEGIGVYPGADDVSSISADGRYVAYHCNFTNLVANDTNGASDVFVHDRLTGRTDRVSIDSSGAEALTGGSFRPAIAADGTLIAFESDASDLVTGDGNLARDVFGRAPVCGDGLLDRSESCDDGNTTDGDGCSSTCELTCLAAPATGCLSPAFPEKGRLVIKDKPEDGKDKLIWKWLKGAVSPKASFGDPLVDDGYLLCMYDATGLVSSALIPAGGLCAGKPCWKEKSKGYLYKDKELTPNGILLLKLNEGLETGKAKILIKAKGEHLDVPALDALTAPVTVQLGNNSGACWETTFSAPFQKQDAETFKDKSD
jgi:cysteine-rich repeat protein